MSEEGWEQKYVKEAFECKSTKFIWHSATDCIYWAWFFQRYADLQNIGTKTDQVTPSSSGDGYIVQVDWREAEDHKETKLLQTGLLVQTSSRRIGPAVA